MDDIEAFKKGISLRRGDEVDGVEILERAVDPLSGVFGFQMRGGGFLSLANAIGRLRLQSREQGINTRTARELACHASYFCRFDRDGKHSDDCDAHTAEIETRDEEISGHHVERAKAWLEARVAEMLERHIGAEKRGCAPEVVGELGAKWAEACECANNVAAILEGREPVYAPPGYHTPSVPKTTEVPVCGRCGNSRKVYYDDSTERGMWAGSRAYLIDCPECCLPTMNGGTT